MKAMPHSRIGRVLVWLKRVGAVCNHDPGVIGGPASPRTNEPGCEMAWTKPNEDVAGRARSGVRS